MDNVKELIEGIKGMGTDGWEAIKSIGKFLNYLMHPSLIIQALWNYTQLYAFWICLAIALISIILYSFGFKKYAKYAPFSISIYMLIKMVSGAF
jgi:predicted ferric reductase